MGELAIGSVVLTRDLAWVGVEPASGDQRNWNGTPTSITDCWVKEGANFYLDMTGEPGEEILSHEWFVLGTFSVNRLGWEVERLHAGERAPDLTDLERASRAAEREKAEAVLQGRVVADAGAIDNVRQDTLYVRGEADPLVIVTVAAGATQTTVEIRPGPGETISDVADRLKGLSRGEPVAFRGTLVDWDRSRESLALSRVRVRSGEVATLTR